MTATATAARDTLDDKVNQVFAGKCVHKDLVRAVKVVTSPSTWPQSIRTGLLATDA
ncbi:MAG: hypothetical protein ACK40D_07510 [Cyanobacteriota bacterium]|jgi:hypothetical protein